jgi:DNA-binding MarR family transcriptional regulator
MAKPLVDKLSTKSNKSHQGLRMLFCPATITLSNHTPGHDGRWLREIGIGNPKPQSKDREFTVCVYLLPTVIELARSQGTAGDLARRLEMTKQAASRLADQLVALGYCDRERSETNRRHVLLSATAEGHGAAMVLVAAIQKMDASMLSSLDSGAKCSTRLSRKCWGSTEVTSRPLASLASEPVR